MQTKKYEVIGMKDEGAYGIVYKCKNKETNEFVAIKKFKEAEEDIVKKTMKRELRMLQQLHHENIVEFKDAFKRKGNLFLVFEYVDRNLLELVQDQPKGIDPKLICSLIFQLCKSIKYLNDKNIIHRDIKPENLLVDDNMILKLCDFGFARTFNKSNEPLTDYVATRWYRSPELLLTKGNYGPEIDYWSIGCIMGELADGEPLFPGENELDQLHCIQKILGNFPDEQVELFYKNVYKGKGLLNITNPETLERRYLGKLPKIAINFMKGLLALDPTKRLNGNNVFSHPYFEKLMERKENSSNKTLKDGRESNYQSQQNIPNYLNNKKQAINQQNSIQPISERIGMTNNNPTTITNINIINYNNYEEGYEPNDEQQQKEQRQLQGNISNLINNNNANNNGGITPSNTNIKIISKGSKMKTNSNGGDMQSNKQQPQYQSKPISNNLQSLPSQDCIPNPSINPQNQNPNPNPNPNQKSNNLLFTSSNFNQKPKGEINMLQGISNAGLDDPAFQTFYKNNKERNLYNIELDLQHCKNNDNNPNMKVQYPNNDQMINEEDEYYQLEKKKQSTKYNNQIYIKQNAKKYEGEYSPSSKKATNLYQMQNNGNMIKGSSPPKYYVGNNISKLYTGKNFHLPAIPKGTIYNNNYNKKYSYLK